MKIPTTPTAPWEGKEAISAHWEEAGYHRFAVVGRSDIISAQVVGGDLLLFPERSAAHKALYAALGLNAA